MSASSPTPMQELQAILANYKHEIDEPDSVRFIAKVRQKGVIADDEWTKLLRWVDDAMTYQKKAKPRGNPGEMNLDADARDADWIRIVRAQRLAGYRMPHWASLWLWRIGHDREEGTFWKKVGRVAKAMKFPPVKETQR